MQLSINGETRQFARIDTVADLIAALELAGKRIAIEHNGAIVPRSQHSQTALSDGDRLEVVVAVGGG